MYLHSLYIYNYIGNGIFIEGFRSTWPSQNLPPPKIIDYKNLNIYNTFLYIEFLKNNYVECFEYYECWWQKINNNKLKIIYWLNFDFKRSCERRQRRRIKSIYKYNTYII